MFITDIEKATYLTAYNCVMLLQDDGNDDVSLNLAGFFNFAICKNFILFINKGLFGFKKLATLHTILHHSSSARLTSDTRLYREEVARHNQSE